jgi:hypothetical protein
MNIRIVTLATLASAILAICILVVWLTAPTMDQAHIAVSKGSYVTVSKIDGREFFLVFNDLKYGPPLSVITGINGVANTNLTDAAWSNLGIFYRCLHHRGGDSWWVFGVSLIYFAGLFAVFPILWICRRQRKRK